MNIYYRKRLSFSLSLSLSEEALQRSRSRVSYLEGNNDGRGGFKDEEGESELEERFYYRIAWGVDAHTHTLQRDLYAGNDRKENGCVVRRSGFGSA